MSANPLLEAALEYAQLGWPVLPLHTPLGGNRVCSCGQARCASPGKHPRIKGAAHAASADEAVVRGWWRRWPEANVGIATGPGAGLVVLDVDPRNGGKKSLQALVEKLGEVPDTPTVSTGGGGQHFYFRHPEGKIPGRGGFRPGLDLKAAGGYVVAPPSLHASGQRYEMYVHPDEQELAPAAGWLRRALEAASMPAGRPLAATAEIPEGGRNAALTSLAGRLRHRGAGEGEILAELLTVNCQQCSPPLDEPEVRGIAASVMRYSPAEPRGGSTVVPDYRPFPLEALPEAIRTFVDRGSKALGCDPGYLAPAVLTTCAAAIGNSTWLRLKQGWREPAVLWSCLVGGSGAKKTPALRAAMGPLQDLQTESLADHARELERYREALREFEAQAKRGKKGRRPEEPVAERYYCSDTTLEAFGGLLKNQPRGLLVFADELAGWLGSFDQYKKGKGSDTAGWLQMHSAQPLTIDRKTGEPKQLHIPMASACVLGGIQPGVLARVFGKQHLENGLAARFLLTYPPSQPSRWTEDELDAADVEGYAGLLRRLHDRQLTVDDSGVPQPQELILLPAARRRFIEFHDAQQEELHQRTGHLESVWSKHIAGAARLALVIQCIRQASESPFVTGEVDDASMDSAVRLIRWFGSEAERVYALLKGRNAKAASDSLLELIRQMGGRATIRELMRARPSLGKTEDARLQLQALVDQGLGKLEIDPGPGPPTWRFTLGGHPTSAR